MTNHIYNFYEEDSHSPTLNDGTCLSANQIFCSFLFLIPIGFRLFIRSTESLLTDNYQPC